MSRVKHKYHYFYRITNKLNNHYYYGVHSTDDLEDGYMGSGTRLHYAYKQYGIENFTKEILKFFDTREKANEYEAEVVNEELLKDEKCYNLALGGGGFGTSGMATVKDKDGKTFLVPVDDPRYLSGELVFNQTGKVLVKDTNNKYFLVPVDDPRYLSGELKFGWTGRSHRPESINKMKETHKKNKHQQGEKNSQYGTCWIHNNEKSIRIKKEELDKYLENGWVKGRKMKF